MTKQNIAAWLTYAGIISFVLLAKLSIFDMTPFDIAPYPLLLVYASVIASFIAGIQNAQVNLADYQRQYASTKAIIGVTKQTH